MPASTAAPPRPTWHIQPMGECAHLIAFEGDDMALANRLALALVRRLDEARLPHTLPAVLGIQSVLWRYDAAAAEPVAIAQALATALADLAPAAAEPETVIEIPLIVSADASPDLPDVAAALGLTPDGVIDALCSHTLRVLMIGFVMGHPYIGPLPAALQLPRRATPRARVTPGSVAIAAGMANIYPVALPGGWHVIGRTTLDVFDPLRDPPALLRAGDGVRYVRVI